jgi:hypothetical protein
MMVLSNFVDVGRDNAFDLTDAWVAILVLQLTQSNAVTAFVPQK